MSVSEETHVDAQDGLRKTVGCVISANDRMSLKTQNMTITRTDIRENVKGQ